MWGRRPLGWAFFGISTPAGVAEPNSQKLSPQAQRMGAALLDFGLQELSGTASGVLSLSTGRRWSFAPFALERPTGYPLATLRVAATESVSANAGM